MTIQQIDRQNRQIWTMARVARANEDGGWYFFSRQTMRFFGDTRRSFAIRCIGGGVFIERIREPTKAPGPTRWVGQLRQFDPQTGHIGQPLQREGGDDATDDQ